MADKEKVIGVKVDTKTAQANVKELNKSFELQQELVDDLENELFEYERALKKTSKADLAGRKKINDAIEKTKDRLKEEKFALKQVNKDKKKANDILKESTANQRDYSGVLGMIDQKTGGAISGFQKLIGTIGGATKGFNLMKIAIIGTGIGALVIAVTSLISAFKGSEEGQNKFAKLMGVIGVVTGNIVDVFADLGDMIISVFENPKKAITDFALLVQQNITNRINGLIELFPQLGKAISQVFEGDFSGAMETSANALGKVTLGLENTTESYKKLTGAVGDFIDKNNDEMKQGAQVADMRAKADKIERSLLKDRALAEREVAELRLKAKDLNNTTAKEREEALKRVLEIEDSLIGREQEVANLRRDAQIAENGFARSTKENLDEEERLKAEAIAVETRRLNKQRQVQRELTQAENQIRAEREAKNKEAQAKQAELDKAEAERKKKLIEEQAKLEEDLLDKKEDLAQREAEGDQYEFQEKLRTLESEQSAYLSKIEELRELELISDEEFRQKKADAEDSFNAQRDAVEEERRLKNKERDAKAKEDEIVERENQIASDLESDMISFENKRLLLDERRQELLSDEQLTEEQRTQLLKQNSEDRKAVDEAEMMHKAQVQGQVADLVGQFGGFLQQIAGENKELAIAGIVAEQVASVSKIISATGVANAKAVSASPLTGGQPFVAFNTISAGLSIAGGLAGAKKAISDISSNKKNPSASGLGSTGGGGGALSASATKLSEFQQSNFDAVGNEASRERRQGQAVANAQSDAPVRAYVTSGDVSSAQSLERNRVDVSGF
jgi:hypothetical protein